MTEKEYRLERLKQKQEEFQNRRIVVYGTGINAEAVLKSFPELNILALMDGKQAGEYLYGKRIISMDEARLLNVEVIIIAAEVVSSYIISERIRPFCIENHITLLNMYGYDEVKLHRQVLEQELKYINSNKKQLMQQIQVHDVICFQLLDVLCACTYFDKDSFWCALEENIAGDERLNVSNFARNRKRAEERLQKNQVYTLEDVYNIFQTVTSVSREERKQLCKTEEHFLLEGFIPKNQGIDLLNWASEQGKKIYIISELHISKENLERLLRELGIKNYQVVIQESLFHLTFSKGALRVGLGEDFGKRTLYIGTNEKNNLILPQLYDMDIFLVKNAWSMMERFSEYKQGKDEFINDSRQNKITEFVQYTYNSPFIEDNSGIDHKKVFFIPKGEQEASREETVHKLDLFTLQEYHRMEELEILNFPVCESIIVTIIIPVYNQFKYTYNCLKSILNNTEHVAYEIIIADDCSTDDTKWIEKLVKGIRILHNKKNLSFLRNCNQASRYAKGKYILFLNNDTQVLLNWLFPLVQLMETKPDAGMVGSKLLYPDGKIQEAGGIIWKDGTALNFGRYREANEPECNYVREVDYVTGASMMIKRTLWEEIGGFDERYAPAYCEDSDLAFEVRKRGKKVLYQPASEVVHFEGISNGKDTDSGIKAYHPINIEKFRHKWKETLEQEDHNKEKNILSVQDRKGRRKTVLFFSTTIPKYDYDAGSKTVFSYLKLFLKKGYIVKFVPSDFTSHEPYTSELRQMGIEVFTGEYYKKIINRWILENKGDIDFVLLNYPICAFNYIRIFKNTSIRVLYYGHDLHFLRIQREYELSGDLAKQELSKEFYEKEKYVIEHADMVYYPSVLEETIVKETFKKNNVRAVPAYIYDVSKKVSLYDPETRKGIIFVGGFNHSPNVDAVLWFVRNVYSVIYEEMDVPFYIVGSHEPYEIQQIKHPGIIHKGFITVDELAELYRNVKLAVIPLRYGAGVKGKVVEAMYHGVPMISTHVGVEGIPEAEKYISVADTKERFVKQLMELYADNERLKRLSLGGQQLIEKYYSEKAVWDVMEKDFVVDGVQSKDERG